MTLPNEVYRTTALKNILKQVTLQDQKRSDVAYGKDTIGDLKLFLISIELINKRPFV